MKLNTNSLKKKINQIGKVLCNLQTKRRKHKYTKSKMTRENHHNRRNLK